MNDTAITIPVRALRQVFVGVVAILLILVFAFAAWQQRDRLDPGIFSRGAGDQIDHSTYQAVFLTSSQLYFGRLATHGDDYFLLTDVFYLPATGDQGQAQPGQLIKRGRELHGPQDVMIIPARNVLFIENLRPDGDVMVAIRTFKESPAAPAATAAPTASPRPSPTR